MRPVPKSFLGKKISFRIFCRICFCTVLARFVTKQKFREKIRGKFRRLGASIRRAGNSAVVAPPHTKNSAVVWAPTRGKNPQWSCLPTRKIPQWFGLSPGEKFRSGRALPARKILQWFWPSFGDRFRKGFRPTCGSQLLGVSALVTIMPTRYIKRLDCPEARSHGSQKPEPGPARPGQVGLSQIGSRKPKAGSGKPSFGRLQDASKTSPKAHNKSKYSLSEGLQEAPRKIQRCFKYSF